MDIQSHSQLRRLCARAGCNAPAVATLHFESTERQAWLAELDDTAARTHGDLCPRHVAALVLPRGWELHDERANQIEVAPVDDDAESDPDDNGSSNGSRARSVPAQFGSHDDDAVDDQLETILDARTPLLRRAFRNARPS